LRTCMHPCVCLWGVWTLFLIKLSLSLSQVVDVTEDDCLVVMACDGVWDVMSDQEAVGA
jgi:hypothetical protein